MHSHLEKSLVKLEETGPNSLKVEFSFPADLSLFEGHFPHYPLLPGIVQIELVRYVLSRHLKSPLFLTKVAKAKFKGQVPPEKKVEVVVTYTEEGEEIQAKGELDTVDGKVSSIVLMLKKH